MKFMRSISLRLKVKTALNMLPHIAIGATMLLLLAACDGTKQSPIDQARHLLSIGNCDEAMNVALKHAEAGDVQSQLFLAIMYNSEKHGNQCGVVDYSKHIYWTHKAATSGSGFGKVLLFRAVINHGNDVVSRSEAKQHLYDAVEMGETMAELTLAGELLKGENFERNCALSLELLKQIYTKSPQALPLLTEYYYGNQCTAPNYEASLKYAKESADNNLCPGHYDLGMHYLLGHGVEKNTELAIEHLTKASKCGHEAATYELHKINSEDEN